MKDVIKILGVYFTYNDSQRKKFNFDEILKSIKEKLRMWKWRDLTIFRKDSDCKDVCYTKIYVSSKF